MQNRCHSFAHKKSELSQSIENLFASKPRILCLKTAWSERILQLTKGKFSENEKFLSTQRRKARHEGYFQNSKKCAWRSPHFPFCARGIELEDKNHEKVWQREFFDVFWRKMKASKRRKYQQQKRLREDCFEV